MNSITLTRPDDWHVHLRDDPVLNNTVPATANYFARALVMPNLKPALTTVHSIVSYRERIVRHIPDSCSFTPLMTLYLNDTVTAEDLLKVKHHPFILGAKLYPAGVTTNSDEGVSSLTSLYPLFEVMQQDHLVLQIHGESTEGDIFYREATFIQDELLPLTRNFPNLRIVLEHISTEVAVNFILEAPNTVAATITPHHLMYHRNHLLANGIKPHYYCLPILKRERDQQALQQAATSGNRKFFAGTDSAPHAIHTKESRCGCAGIFSAPYALPCYAHVFEQLNQLDKLEAFVSHFGADFYQMPHNQGSLTLEKKPQTIPMSLPFGDEDVVPIEAGEVLPWSVLE